jgi:hypothetical protein
MPVGTIRSTRDVIEAHLANRRRGDVETDLRCNYSEGVVLLLPEGDFHGCDGVRKVAGMLGSYADGDRYDYELAVVDELALLQWRATSPEVSIQAGADTFVVRDGRIRSQVVHCRA